MRIVLASVLLLLASMGAGLAQESDRFSLEKTAEGYVLDKRTGRVSTCVEQSGQLVCRLAADERSAFEDEIDRLRGEVEELEKRVTALEAAAGNKALPSEDEFDRTMSYMQRFFRSFLDMVKEFDRDLRGGGAAEDSAPNKT